MIAWVNGRRNNALDVRDRGLQYGDGLFETMRVRRGEIRFLEKHLKRLYLGCKRLRMVPPSREQLRRELNRVAAMNQNAVLKLIITRGSGERGYRPTGRERTLRVVTLQALPKHLSADDARPVAVRVCATPLGGNPVLAGMKTLNRLESVMARSEWRDPGIWEGLMLDHAGSFVCGTMSNLFLQQGSALMTPLLDRCGVAGVMRGWVMASAHRLNLHIVERRIEWRDLTRADEVFMTNAIVGVRSVRAVVQSAGVKATFGKFDVAERLRALLAAQ